MTVLILCLATAYLIGSFSSAILLSKLLKFPDPRESGSHNPGATNVLRLGGKKAAAIVLIIDMLKGLLSVLIAKGLGLQGMELAFIALAAVIGHVFPIFYKFKGGKGVATALGGFFGLSFILGLLATLVWILVAKFWRYSSLSSLSAGLSAPIFSMALAQKPFFIPLFLIAALLIWTHKSNIERIINGLEPKLGEDKTSDSDHQS